MPTSSSFSSRGWVLVGLTAALACGPAQADGMSGLDSEPGQGLGLLGTKTPYPAPQGPVAYEAAPEGYVPVYSEMVARHGSRGQSSPGGDLALYDLCLQAKERQQLTPPGERLLSDLWALIRANTLLGQGAPSGAPGTSGYGRLTALGEQEHRELAQRWVQRLPTLLNAKALQAEAAPRQLVFANSGVLRAAESAESFRQGLRTAQPGLEPLFTEAEALTAYPADAPRRQAPGVNRFELYFHKLHADTDLPPEGDAHAALYRLSLQYQDVLRHGPALQAQLQALHDDPALRDAARQVLAAVFQDDFLQALGRGEVQGRSRGGFSIETGQGHGSVRLEGDGKARLSGWVDAALALYEAWAIVPALRVELPQQDLQRDLPASSLQALALYVEASNFYEKGPGTGESARLNRQISQGLLEDFLNEVDAIQARNLSHAAKLRFSHAEALIPFVALLGVPGASEPLPSGQPYSHDHSPWRAAQVAPLAANVQWDVFRNAQGALLLRALFNERPMSFDPSCEGGRHAPGSDFYDYLPLRACLKARMGQTEAQSDKKAQSSSR